MILDKGLRSKTNIKFLILPENDDPASILQNNDPGYMKKLLSGSMSLVRFALGKTHFKEGMDYTREAIKLIRKVRDPLMRNDLVRELVEATGGNERAIREELSGFKRTMSDRAHTEEKPEGLIYDEEHLLLSASAASPERAHAIMRRVSADEFRDATIRGIFQRLGSGSVQEAAETEAERALVTGLMLQPGFDEDDINKVIDDCVRKIHRRKVEDRIQAARTAGDLDLLGRLLNERQKLLQEAR